MAQPKRDRRVADCIKWKPGHFVTDYDSTFCLAEASVKQCSYLTRNRIDAVAVTHRTIARAMKGYWL